MRLISKGFYYKGNTQKIYRSEWEEIYHTGGLVQFYFKYKYWYLSSDGLDYCIKEFSDVNVTEAHVPSSMFVLVPKGQEMNGENLTTQESPNTILAPHLKIASAFNFKAATGSILDIPSDEVDRMVEAAEKSKIVPKYEEKHFDLYLSDEDIEQLTESAKKQAELNKEHAKKAAFFEDQTVPFSEKFKLFADPYMSDGEFKDVIYKSGTHVDDWGRPSYWSSVQYVKNTDDLNVPEHFNTWLDQTLQRIKETLSVKGNEYSKETTFQALEDGAKENDMSVPTYISVLSSKHVVNRKKWRNNPELYPIQKQIDEKYLDPLVYQILEFAWITNQKRKIETN